MALVGVDACKGGWIAVCLVPQSAARGLFVPTLEELASSVPEAKAFAVDIPIGLPTEGRRSADVAARKFVGARRNSVFFAPVRTALQAPTHAEATEASRQLTGHGVSQQAYALGPKILEAERWRRHAPAPVWEVHPEVSFAVLLGHPARSPKKTWAGMFERLDALRSAGIELSDPGEAGERAAVDDVLDAAVAAWSAERLLNGRGLSLPDPPEVDPTTGNAMAIWA